MGARANFPKSHFCYKTAPGRARVHLLTRQIAAKIPDLRCAHGQRAGTSARARPSLDVLNSS